MPAGALRRVFGRGADQPVIGFQVIAHGRPREPVDENALEEAAESALEELIEHAADTALGPVVGCDFGENRIEVMFTIEARSAEQLHRKLGHILGILERVPLSYDESMTRRLDPDRDAVLA